MPAHSVNRLAPVLALLLAVPSPGSATEPEHATEHAEPGTHHGDHHHVVSMILFIATEERAEGGAGVGLEYEYRFHRHWGGAAFAEYIAGTLETGVYGVTANYHPTERLLIATGPGLESSHDHTQALWRLGGLYEFEAGEVTIAPALYWDWLEGGHHVFLVGVSFGKRF